MPVNRSSQQGFALIVIAALLAAFGLAAAAIIDRHNATQALTKQEVTRAQITRLSSALVQYALFNNNQYPCPARADLPTSNTDFGVSVTDCATNDANITVIAGSSVIRGMVPVRALVPFGIDPTDAIDGWNNKIMYVVERHLTTYNGVATSRPAVVEQNSGLAFRPPDYMVVSYGRDGIGGIPWNYTTVAIPCTGTGLRQSNCDDDLNFVQGPPMIASTVANENYLDDILAFYTALPKPCPAQRLNWNADCSANFPITASGAVSPMMNSDVPSWTGSANALCMNSTWQPPVGSCTSACTGTMVNCSGTTRQSVDSCGNVLSSSPNDPICMAPGCNAAVLSWSQNGNTCYGSFAAVPSGEGCVNADATGRYAGKAYAVCSGNAWGAASGDCGDTQAGYTPPPAYPVCP